MSSDKRAADAAQTGDTDVDAVVVGAGFSGLYMLHRLRDELGLSVKVIEKADDVGGTWYWNKYPGARCDSRSWFYCFSFDEEIRDEWQYSEKFPEQPEILEYQRFVADRLDLRRDIEFNTEVTSAAFDENAGVWNVETDDGSTISSQFFVPAVGNLSKPYLPDFDGLESFGGEWYHTAKWPEEGVDLSGKRVGLVGTGSTGIQIMPRLAERSEHLTVFQRTPNYGVPARNEPLTDEEWEEIRENYEEMWEEAHASDAGLGFDTEFDSIDEASEEEIDRALEEGWENGAQGLLNVFTDVMVNEESNERVAEFIRSKIREIVDDPEVAEKLVPTDHPYGAKRPPLTYDGYYEKYNRDDVELVDVGESPIERIETDGIRTGDSVHDLDIIVFATGFDAVTGTFEQLNIQGRNGIDLEEKWDAGPRTHLGLAVHGFPNMFMVTGPQSPSVLTNMTVAIEQHVEWISDCIEYMLDNDYSFIEPTEEAENEWNEHNDEVVDQTLFDQANSWYRGDNIPGKESTFLIYPGGLIAYNEKCDEVVENDYEGFELKRSIESAIAD
ncbi:cyclohexanone monooxygenase (plasmid) [Haloterrigena turkmenica DSM 5511]|uniref:Cyclohexanone monooxygenase n=1 Tax=Haloterrigena turkmenica (strain ATCC 51198 / DSM 5511 / JCM 9101 / NCIMB 13204 / VKM B-1734 / 4k) TaxID=543526 RepID=D2S001_HALTV|nr:NAD(P)/FAD-dependent oxidoreductase [Haloterrigena turkmenica]ADB62698.1 cyclohexanone monooxygenase [Haloterrigena turkmenica DSM 5511]